MQEAPDGSRGLTERQAARRERVVKAAIALASSGGYDAVQMRDVAAKARVALGTLYRYFSSKDHLLVSCLGEWTREFQQQIRRQLIDRRRHAVQHRVEPLGLELVYPVDDLTQDAEQRRGFVHHEFAGMCKNDDIGRVGGDERERTGTHRTAYRRNSGQWPVVCGQWFSTSDRQPEDLRA